MAGGGPGSIGNGSQDGSYPSDFYGGNPPSFGNGSQEGLYPSAFLNKANPPSFSDVLKAERTKKILEFKPKFKEGDILIVNKDIQGLHKGDEVVSWVDSFLKTSEMREKVWIKVNSFDYDVEFFDKKESELQSPEADKPEFTPKFRNGDILISNTDDFPLHEGYQYMAAEDSYIGYNDIEWVVLEGGTVREVEFFDKKETEQQYQPITEDNFEEVLLNSGWGIAGGGGGYDFHAGKCFSMNGVHIYLPEKGYKFYRYYKEKGGEYRTPEFSEFLEFIQTRIERKPLPLEKPFCFKQYLMDNGFKSYASHLDDDFYNNNFNISIIETDKSFTFNRSVEYFSYRLTKTNADKLIEVSKKLDAELERT